MGFSVRDLDGLAGHQRKTVFRFGGLFVTVLAYDTLFIQCMNKVF